MSTTGNAPDFSEGRRTDSSCNPPRPAAAPPPGTPASEEDFELVRWIAEYETQYPLYLGDKAPAALRRVLAEAREAQRHRDFTDTLIGQLRSRVEQLEGALREISCVDACGAWWAWIPRLAASVLAPETKESEPK